MKYLSERDVAATELSPTRLALHVVRKRKQLHSKALDDARIAT